METAVTIDYYAVFIRLFMAVILGALIGFERSYHGRPAGLRTHTLVSTSATLLMLVTVFQWDLLAGVPIDTIRVDPTRMGQGIMTGIGFLGAGVILKEKLTIRGLTTATSIWMASAIGIVVGMGFFTAATAAAFITILVLNGFGWLERKLPTYNFSRLLVRCKRNEAIAKSDLFEIVKSHNFKTNNPSYELTDEGHFIQYEFTIQTKNSQNLETLAQSLIENQLIVEFSLIRLGR